MLAIASKTRFISLSQVLSGPSLPRGPRVLPHLRYIQERKKSSQSDSEGEKHLFTSIMPNKNKSKLKRDAKQNKQKLYAITLNLHMFPEIPTLPGAVPRTSSGIRDPGPLAATGTVHSRMRWWKKNYTNSKSKVMCIIRKNVLSIITLCLVV